MYTYSILYTDRRENARIDAMCNFDKIFYIRGIPIYAENTRMQRDNVYDVNTR